MPVFGFSGQISTSTDTLQFIANELLGRPTANSITVNACANQNLDVYYEYGTDSLNYLYQTTVKSCLDSIPFVFVLGNLNPNTQYFYRMRYRLTGTTEFLSRNSHTFHTQRPSGSEFTFAVEADPHLDTNSNPAVYTLTLQNILSKKPDFLLDLGDTFMSEKLPVVNQIEILKRHLLLRSYYDITCHSVPLFLVLGNHEGELGWLLDSTANNLPVWAANTRTLYYPNPLPDSFYSGNTKSESFVGLRQNYYSWQWGDALFVVLDPYWYTKKKPNWGWTLGVDQYNWFKNVITGSQAKYKFVFCHQLVGGDSTDGRGGIEFANLWEMGGYNTDSTWGFDTYRPGWGKPIHTLMVENNATIFFHGHDHFFGKQDKDGIVYQEVPQPSARSYTSNSAAAYGYINGVIIPSRGYLLVTVSDTGVGVQYLRTYLPAEENAQRHNGDISYSYSIINGVLPVGLKQFSAITSKRNVVLNWSTKSEYNMNSFNIERSLVSSNIWVEIGKVIASGTSNSDRAYNFIDQSLNSGKYNYRLKMLNNDGSSTFSNVISTEVETPSEFKLEQNYPNPFNPSTNIIYDLPVESKVLIKIYNSAGGLVTTLVDKVQPAGYQSASWNAHGISSGVYFYTFNAIAEKSSESYKNNGKMILLK